MLCLKEDIVEIITSRLAMRIRRKEREEAAQKVDASRHLEEVTITEKTIETVGRVRGR